MSLGLLLLIILVIALLGGFSGRFGGPGYATDTAGTVRSGSYSSSSSSWSSPIASRQRSVQLAPLPGDPRAETSSVINKCYCWEMFTR